MDVLTTTDLTKSYNGQTVVDQVNLAIATGEIFGLIGENGAGKTTLMRLITGLSRPDSGQVNLFSATTPSGLAEARHRVGSVIETPAMYPNLTAHQNLECHRLQCGITDTGASARVLEQVGLTKAGKKKAHAFSLGMKQRLGLALALVNQPDFIILDEPVNGLDPMGVIEMRDLIRALSAQGVTVLISSHILAELAQVATRYAIIHHGRILTTLTSEQLHERCSRALAITVDDTAAAAVALETALGIHNYRVYDASQIRIYEQLDNPVGVTTALTQAGVRVTRIAEVGDTLEDFFINTISGATK